jgi:signal transduction histidine kinase
MPELIRRAVDRVRGSILKQVRIELDLGGNVPPVEGDAGQIEQLLVNLVLNAAEATGDTAGRVEVRIFPAEGRIETEPASPIIPPGRYAVIEVSDSGCGMDEALKSRIFDPFFSTKFTGRGLGLAAVLGIVRGHSGGIQVLSSPGRGSTFRVFLPAARAAESAEASAVAREQMVVIRGHKKPFPETRASLPRQSHWTAARRASRTAV